MSANARTTLAQRLAGWRGSAIASIMVGCVLSPETNFMSDKAFLDTNILLYAHEPPVHLPGCIPRDL